MYPRANLFDLENTQDFQLRTIQSLAWSLYWLRYTTDLNVVCVHLKEKQKRYFTLITAGYGCLWIIELFFLLFFWPCISVFNQLDAQNCFTISFISCLYMFRAHVLIIRRSKLHYTASGIITPIGVEAWNKTYCETILCIKLVKYWDKYIALLRFCDIVVNFLTNAVIKLLSVEACLISAAKIDVQIFAMHSFEIWKCSRCVHWCTDGWYYDLWSMSMKC